MSCNDIIDEPSDTVKWIASLDVAVAEELLCVTNKYNSCVACPTAPPTDISSISGQCLVCLEQKCPRLNKLKGCSTCYSHINLDQPPEDIVNDIKIQCYNDKASSSWSSTQIFGVIFGTLILTTGVIGIIIWAVIISKKS
jgi:hypothetical protein